MKMINYGGILRDMDEQDLVCGTSLKGDVVVDYKTMCEVFGEPNGDTDDYKVDVEWILMTPEGVATIYNYKDGINYNGDEGIPNEDLNEWHIGGHTSAVVDVIKKALETKGVEL